MNTVNVVTERDNYALTTKSVCMSFVKVGEWEIECNIFTIFILYTFMCLSIFQYFVLCLFFIRLNKITKHKSHVHCLIMKSTPLLEKDPKHSIPLFMKRKGCFMLSTFLFGQLQCYSVANHAI